MAILNGNLQRVLDILKIIGVVITVIVAFALTQQSVGVNTENIKDHEVRIEDLEKSDRARDRDVEYIRESLKRIEDKLDKRR